MIAEFQNSIRESIHRTLPTGISKDAMGSISHHLFFEKVIQSLERYANNYGMPYIIHGRDRERLGDNDVDGKGWIKIGFADSLVVSWVFGVGPYSVLVDRPSTLPLQVIQEQAYGRDSDFQTEVKKRKGVYKYWGL